MGYMEGILSQMKGGILMNKKEAAELLERLREMKETNIEQVNRDDLVDIKDVKIKTELPLEERILDYIRQIKNPYCYLDHGVIVKLSFTGERSIEDCLKTIMLATD